MHPTLLVILLIGTAVAASPLDKGPAGERGHRCIHDTPAIQNSLRDLANKTLSVNYTYPGGRGFHSHAMKKMRFYISDADLDNPAQYCTQEGQSRSDFNGKTVTCIEEDVLTLEKKTILKRIVRQASELLSNALKVNPVAGRLVVEYECPEPFTTPTSHKTVGVEADYVLYVAAAPTDGGTVAWAAACTVDGTGRPLTGRANFGPRYLKWDDANPMANEELVRTGAHELLHALGFSNGIWESYAHTKPFTKKAKRRGKTITYVTTPRVVAMARHQFGCETLLGAETEDQGGSGTAGSHWERRNHYDDMMAGVTNPMMFLSPVTLALMEDLGYYGINWGAAELPVWMRNIGCGAENSYCNDAEGGKDVYFCFQKGDGCTVDRTGAGPCGISDQLTIPRHFQYYTQPNIGGTTQLTDFCPTHQPYGNVVCTDPNNSVKNSTSIALYFAATSRCYNTSNIRKKGSSGVNFGNYRCLDTRCEEAAGLLISYFRVGNSEWIKCPTAGFSVNLDQYGYVGEVTCPPPEEVCTKNLYNATNNQSSLPLDSFPKTTEAPSDENHNKDSGSGSGTEVLPTRKFFILTILLLLLIL